MALGALIHFSSVVESGENSLSLKRSWKYLNPHSCHSGTLAGLSWSVVVNLAGSASSLVQHPLRLSIAPREDGDRLKITE